MSHPTPRVLAAAVALVALGSSCVGGEGSTPAPISITPGGGGAAGGGEERVGILLAAGDIACAPGAPVTPTSCHHAGTARLLTDDAVTQDALLGVLLLGDTQYERGLDREYDAFDRTWGAAIEAGGSEVFPATGNHEYTNDDPAPPGCPLIDPGQHACGFARYFGAAPFSGVASDRHASYVRLIGASSAHPLVLVVLDVGRCERDPVACARGGPVPRFLGDVLRDPDVNPPAACTVVAWHQARWSDYGHGDLAFVDPIWRALFVGGAQRPDLVLNGHDHLYARLPSLDADGDRDRGGIVEIIAGAGGKEVLGIPFAADPPGRTAFADVGRFGVVRVTWEPLAGTLGTAFVTEGLDLVDERTLECS